MFQATERKFEVEPQITFEVLTTPELRADLSKRLCHATHVDWEYKGGDVWECTFDVEFESVFMDWALYYADVLEYHAI